MIDEHLVSFLFPLISSLYIAHLSFKLILITKMFEYKLAKWMIENDS